MLDMAKAWLRLAGQVEKYKLNEIEYAPPAAPRKRD
jgi:hypothetical protein